MMPHLWPAQCLGPSTWLPAPSSQVGRTHPEWLCEMSWKWRTHGPLPPSPTVTGCPCLLQRQWPAWAPSGPASPAGQVLAAIILSPQGPEGHASPAALPEPWAQAHFLDFPGLYQAAATLERQGSTSPEESL